ncbi:MAG: hypothetical protein ACP5NZ_02555 [Nanobdellota archaeon]
MKAIISNKQFEELKLLLKNWVILVGWILILLLFVQTIGIVIHEVGHYAAGKAYGCENLSISIAKLSWKDSISNVSGWETCKFPLVMNKDGTRVCNPQTNIVSIAGLTLSLIILIPLVIFLNRIFRTKVKRLHLKNSYLFLVLLFVIFMAIESASIDLFKIGECLFNTQVGETIRRISNLLSTLIIIPIYLVFVYDLIGIIRA